MPSNPPLSSEIINYTCMATNGAIKNLGWILLFGVVATASIWAKILRIGISARDHLSTTGLHVTRKKGACCLSHVVWEQH